MDPCIRRDDGFSLAVWLCDLWSAVIASPPENKGRAWRSRGRLLGAGGSDAIRTVGVALDSHLFLDYNMSEGGVDGENPWRRRRRLDCRHTLTSSSPVKPGIHSLVRLGRRGWLDPRLYARLFNKVT